MLYIFSAWFLLFLLYSVLGYIVEILSVSIRSKKIVLNRGFLIGPYLPIYGIGALIMIFFLQGYEDDLLALFIMGAFYCTLLEYITSLLMEKIFKLRWWDYSQKKFNINGRVCLDNACLFGICSILVIKLIQPFFKRMIYLLPEVITIMLAIILLFIFVIDFIESFFITVRLKKTITKYVRKDATSEIKKEVMNAIRKHTTLTSRLLKAFPNMSYEANKKFMEFLQLVFETRQQLRYEKKKKKKE